MSGEKCITLQNFLWEVLKGRDYLQELGVDVRIIFNCILKKFGGRLMAGGS
jgi:hypothetical protein